MAKRSKKSKGLVKKALVGVAVIGVAVGGYILYKRSQQPGLSTTAGKG